MKLEITNNEIVKKLIRLKKKHVPESIRWFITTTYWDDGDFEIKLHTSWGTKLHMFVYRYSLDKYFYDIEEHDKYKDMKELK